MANVLSPTLKRSFGSRDLICNQLTDPNRGIILPGELGFAPNGFDPFGRPQRVNLASVTSYYKKDILALDRLMLPESNRLHPLYPFQRTIFKEAVRAQFLWLQVMRGGAKTYTLARFALNYALQNPNVPIVFTGPSFRQALLAYDCVLQLIALNAKNENSAIQIRSELHGDPKRNSTESILWLQNGSSLRALPMGDGSKIRGIRGGVLILDEFYLMTEEQYESHVKPFVGVRQGGLDSKVIHATTSWFQDCFAYKRLMQIASEVKAGNTDYAILDFNLKDIAECGFPLDPGIYNDALRHGNKTVTAMTYFNIWPTTQLRWFEQQYIDQAISAKNQVKIEFKAVDKCRYFATVDLAASEKGDSTEVVVWKFEDGKIKAVWAHQEKGLGPAERALLIHRVYENFIPEFIIYDNSAAIGSDTRKMLSERKLFIKGVEHKVTPLVHHDAFNLSGKHVLIPAMDVDDKAVREALMGPKDGTSIRGLAGLRESLFTQCKDLLMDNLIVGPSEAASLVNDDGTLKQYTGSEREVVDILVEAFNQLGGIGLRKDKDGNVKYSDDGRLLFDSRPGVSKDDGAMCIAYAVIGFNRCLGKNNLLRHAAMIRRDMVIAGHPNISKADVASIPIQVLVI